MNSDALLPAKTLLGALIMKALGVYAGAIIIALIAALVRTVYKAEITEGFTEFSLAFVQFFILAFGLAMLVVHIGQWQGWSENLVIIVSSFVAFMSRETLDIVSFTFTASKKKVMEYVLSKIFK